MKSVILIKSQSSPWLISDSRPGLPSQSHMKSQIMVYGPLGPLGEHINGVKYLTFSRNLLIVSISTFRTFSYLPGCNEHDEEFLLKFQHGLNSQVSLLL